MKQNCWEFKKCGRQPSGAKAKELGICPASTEPRLSGVHGGKNGGRCCWAIQKTLCGGNVQGTFASKLGNCMKCDFYKLVKQEEGAACLSTSAILQKIAPLPGAAKSATESLRA